LPGRPGQKLFQKSPLDPAQVNVLRDSFLSDPLRFKAFIGFLLPNNNLKYAGAGSFGMIFKTDGGLKLDPEFQSSDFSVDSTPIEGFNPQMVDEALDLSSRNLTSSCILALGYRKSEEDYLVSTPKFRFPQKELFVTS